MNPVTGRFIAWVLVGLSIIAWALLTGYKVYQADKEEVNNDTKVL